MIIFTFVDHGKISTLWGLFAAGCILGGAAILGVFTGFTLRPGAKALVSATFSIHSMSFN
jgi:hypothetical protein